MSPVIYPLLAVTIGFGLSFGIVTGTALAYRVIDWIGDMEDE